MSSMLLGFSMGMIIGLVLGIYITAQITAQKNQKEWDELSASDKMRTYIVMAFIFLVSLTGLAVFAFR